MESRNVKGRFAAVFVGLLFIDFLLLATMLVTDKNLQTDFGTVPPYFVHWYGVLALAVVTLFFAVLIIVTGGRSSLNGNRSKMARLALAGGAAWCWLSIVAMVGVLATWKQVGATSANQFAQYLFGVTPYPGVQAYIPWLYDLLLALFIVSGIVGVTAVSQNRTSSRETQPT
jgi:hypothetical protein